MRCSAGRVVPSCQEAVTVSGNERGPKVILSEHEPYAISRIPVVIPAGWKIAWSCSWCCRCRKAWGLCTFALIRDHDSGSIGRQELCDAGQQAVLRHRDRGRTGGAKLIRTSLGCVCKPQGRAHLAWLRRGRESSILHHHVLQQSQDEGPRVVAALFEESDRYPDVHFCVGKRHIDRRTLPPVVMDQAILHLMRAGARVRACVWRVVVSSRGTDVGCGDGLPMGHSS